MVFEKIDRSSWKRNEYFENYFTNIPCTYSMTVKLDITQIKKKRMKLYPAMLYYLATIVNRHSEFRTAINQEGELGIYDEMIPSYTIFRTQRHFPTFGHHTYQILKHFLWRMRMICNGMEAIME